MRGRTIPNWAVPLSVALQLPLALFLGHQYDARVFMATGYLAASGFNPYVARDLSAVLGSSFGGGLTSIGYPPPWALVMALAYLVSHALTGNLLVYNLLTKLPVIAANVGLAYGVAWAARGMGAPKKAQRWSFLFMLFNPFLLYTTAAWGQLDGVVALCALAGLTLLQGKRSFAAAVMLALAVSLKPIALPLLPLALLVAGGRDRRNLGRLSAGLVVSLAAFCAFPFAVFRWDPGVIFRNWSVHSEMAGGMSWLTFFEPVLGMTNIPPSLRALGFIWVPALAAGVVLLRPRADENLSDLFHRSLRLLLVLFLSRAWLSEPNVDLLIPFAVVLYAVGLFGRGRLTALWVIPFAFTLLNASPPQLLFLLWPRAMTVMADLDTRMRVLRLLARCAVVIPWLVLGWRIVLSPVRNRAARRGSTRWRVAGRSHPWLSVVLPTYNEAENIAETVDRVERALARVPRCRAEVVVVDDGSPDGTAARAAQVAGKYHNVRIVRRNGREGLASAIVRGMAESRGDFIAVMDADLQHPPESLPTLVGRIRETDADVVIMSRFCAAATVSHWNARRRLASRIATGLAHALLPCTRAVRDPVSGFFAVRRTALRGMALQPRGFKILPELLARGKRLRTEEIAYAFHPRVRGRSKMGPAEVLRYTGLLLTLRRTGAR